MLPEYKVIFFELSTEKAKERLLGRMFDKETGETFPAGTTINPKNGNTLVKRDDKDENAILKRIERIWNKNTSNSRNSKTRKWVVAINANQAIEKCIWRNDYKIMTIKTNIYFIILPLS